MVMADVVAHRQQKTESLSHGFVNILSILVRKEGITSYSKTKSEGAVGEWEDLLNYLRNSPVLNGFILTQQGQEEEGELTRLGPKEADICSGLENIN